MTEQQKINQVTTNDKIANIVAHMGGLIGPIGILIPIAVLLLNKKDRFDHIESIDAINFQLTFLILFFITVILVSVLKLGVFAWLGYGLWLANIVLCIIACISIANGKTYRYPFEFQFLKNYKK